MNNPSTTKFHILSHPISASHPLPNGPASAPEAEAATAHDTSGPSAGGGARRGRPTVFSDKVFAMMKDYARRLGFSDSAAAEGVGVSSSTISRWKKENPEIAHELQTARQECRIHHLERIMQFAEGDDNRGLRASMWLLERLFPGDYAPRMSERFAHRNFEDRAREREEAALHEENLREAQAARAAEAHQTYMAVLAAYEAEIAQHAGAAPRAESDPPAGPASVAAAVPPRSVERENAASASEGDSHNSRNAGEAELPADSIAPAPRSPQSAKSPEWAEAATVAEQPRARAGEGPATGAEEPMHFSSVSDSHNSRNSGETELPPRSDAHAQPSPQATTADQRQETAADQGLAAGPEEPRHFSSKSHSHNSRNSSPSTGSGTAASVVPAAPHAGGC